MTKILRLTVLVLFFGFTQLGVAASKAVVGGHIVPIQAFSSPGGGGDTQPEPEE